MVGERVAAILAVPFIDLDKEIAEDIPAVFRTEGEAGFRRRETEALGRCAQGAGVLALGGGTLESPTNRALLHGWTILVLMAQLPTLQARIGAGEGRPLAHRLAELIAARTPTWQQFTPWIWTDHRTPDAIAGEITEVLRGAA